MPQKNEILSKLKELKPTYEQEGLILFSRSHFANGNANHSINSHIQTRQTLSRVGTFEY